MQNARVQKWIAALCCAAILSLHCFHYQALLTGETAAAAAAAAAAACVVTNFAESLHFRELARILPLLARAGQLRKRACLQLRKRWP
jgi:hypothetical protein